MLRTAWYKWFAWYPIYIRDKFVWFKTVERRDVQDKGGNWSEYRHV